MNDLQLFRLILEIASSLRNKGSWTGETHVQKVGYFLQHIFDVPLQADYVLYKHGPYSFDLRRTLSAMRAYQYLDWQPNPEPYGPTLVDGQLAGTLKKFTRDPIEYREKIDFVCEWLGPKRVSELERLATALYANLNQKTSPGERPGKICELKPHVTMVEAQAAVAELDRFLDTAQHRGLMRPLAACGAA